MLDENIVYHVLLFHSPKMLYFRCIHEILVAQSGLNWGLRGSPKGVVHIIGNHVFEIIHRILRLEATTVGCGKIPQYN